jgi:UDP:flavonoid glycosyltransferase YjiC (YdhE family)
MAVPPNLVGFVESVGLPVVEYGPDSQELIDDDFVHNFFTMQPLLILRAFSEYVSRGWQEMSATLKSQADGADLVLTGTIYQGVAVNIAEYYGIPLAALHFFPQRANGHLIPRAPAVLTRSAISAVWWWYWRMTKNADDTQRRELGLPRAVDSLSKRISDSGALEIQAYEHLCFPGLAAEWQDRWPFIGALTLQLPTATDADVQSWIGRGKPPIYFGFGSMPVKSAADTVAMISAACAELGERALICSGWADFGDIPESDDVKVVPSVNHGAVFPACRAVVHHGGAGTTAAGLRAGVPTLILWVTSDQPVWAAQVSRLKVGHGHRFSSVSKKSLVSDLRRILAPSYAERARAIAREMTTPAASAAAAADLLEESVRMKPVNTMSEA